MPRMIRFALVFIAVLTSCKARNSASNEAFLMSAPEQRIAVDIADGAPLQMTYKGSNYKKSSSLKIINLGKISVDASTGISDFIDFEIPPQTLGFSIHLSQPGRKDYIYTYSMVDSNGVEVISPNPSGVDASVLSTLGGRGQKISRNATLEETFLGFSSTLVPNGNEVEIPEGVWRLSVAVENPKLTGNVLAVNGAVILKCKNGGLDEGDVGRIALKLNVSDKYEFGSVKDLTPKTDKSLPSILEETGKLYATAGVKLEVADVKSLDTRFDSAELSALDATPNVEFFELMTKFIGGTVPSAPVFMLKPSGTVIYSGIAAYGALAFGYVPSEKFAGIIVQESLTTSKGPVLGHELGHALGLYHTNMDNLPDTFALNHYIYGDQITPLKGDFRKNLIASRNFMVDGSNGSRDDLVMTASQKRIIRHNPFVAIYSKK